MTDNEITTNAKNYTDHNDWLEFSSSVINLGTAIRLKMQRAHIDGAMSRNTEIQELQNELEKERKLNAEIKARFVKCNTCTDEMKDKCLMFSENLCGGERCEELVDLMGLVSKSDCEIKLTEAKEILSQLANLEGVINIPMDKVRSLVVKAEAFLKE